MVKSSIVSTVDAAGKKTRGRPGREVSWISVKGSIVSEK